MVKNFREYFRKNELNDPARRTLNNADEKFKVIFDGKTQVSVFELIKLVSGHIIE